MTLNFKLYKIGYIGKPEDLMEEILEVIKEGEQKEMSNIREG